MIGLLFQQGYYINFVMILIEALISIIILYFITKNVSKPLLEEIQMPVREKSLSSIVSILIVLGIIIAIRYIFGFLGYFFSIFILLNDKFFSFALMTSFFYPLYKFFIEKFGNVRCSDKKNLSSYKNYVKRSILVIGASWVVALIFMSINLLEIPLGHLIPPDLLNPTYDVFLLGFEWAFFVVIINMSIVFTINKIIPIEKRLPEEALHNSMLFGGIISFGAWSIQLVLIELYLSRLFGLTLYEQDIRILIITVTVIFFIFLLTSLKLKFLPQASEKSRKIIHAEFQREEKIQGEIRKTGKKEMILDVQELTTYFYTEEGVVHALEGVSFKINEGEVLGLVGETGCGKTVTALSILRLIRPPGEIVGGKVMFGDIDLHKKSEIEVLPLRGKDITMIFQDPLNSLNPVFKVGSQISEVFLLHKKNELLIEASKYNDKSIYSVAREWSKQLLKDLNIYEPDKIFDQYPHELSGGMRQRIQIAMGLACSPKLLIADEPTTALDVTIQNQILKLMKDLKKKYNTAILFITHDLGIISKMCDKVAVMYSGFIVENGDRIRLFTNPYHPYTKGLISSIPIIGEKKELLVTIPGMVPNLIYPPSGCRFHPRCQYCFEPCVSKVPKSIMIEPDYFVACHLYDPAYKEIAERSINNMKEKLSTK
ncbi:MAG: ABC transporter ATP-binding protein [Promethearchaeota archaeon]